MIIFKGSDKNLPLFDDTMNIITLAFHELNLKKR